MNKKKNTTKKARRPTTEMMEAPTPPPELTTIPTEDQLKTQRAKDLLELALKEKEKIHPTVGKPLIPTRNTSFLKKWLKIGNDYNLTQDTELKQPILLLIRNDKTVEIIEDRKPGLFKINTIDNQGKEKIKTLLLDETKIVHLPHPTLQNETISTWIHYENEALSYPIEPEKDAGILAKFLEQFSINYRMLDEKEQGGFMGFILKALPWVFGALAVAYVLYKMGVFDKFITQAVMNTTANITQNITATVQQSGQVKVI